MLNLHLDYIKETYDENGVISAVELNCPENYNFAFDVVDRLAAHSPDKLAMMWANDKGNEKRITFGEMKRYSDKAANYFLSKGIKKGDKVMLILKRHYQFWYALLGLHKIGAVAIPATNLLTKKDLIYRFGLAGVKAMLCTNEGEIAIYAEQAFAEYPDVSIRMMARGSFGSSIRDGWDDFDAEIEAADDTLERYDTCKNDCILLYFTSGTTGQPKMVMHDQTYTIGHIMTAKHWQNVDPNGLHLTFSETGWAKAVWGKIYGQWLMEAGIFVYDFDKFTPVDLLPLFSKYNVTSFCAPPTVFRFLIKEDLSKFDLSSLKYVTIAGEALNPEVYNQFYAATGLKLMEGFGQTETTCIIMNPKGTTPKPGSMGKPNPQYRVEIVDENGNPVPDGTVGEIALHAESRENRPFGLYCGYYRDEELTNSVWHDGLYHTGDTAWRDEDGFFWYVGRVDDIIKSSGYRIGPFEIESVLMEHPAVLECAITGVPDPMRGQIVKATIILTKNYQPSEELKKELQTYVKKQTAPYKYPRIIEFVDELPKTISGKIKRVDIRECK